MRRLMIALLALWLMLFAASAMGEAAQETKE